MSVVVRWTIRGRRVTSRHPQYRQRLRARRMSSSKLMPPATLASNQRISSLAWIGERCSRYGSVRP